MKLTELRIENFRSFVDETIRLDDYTCLVGANGSGKSVVLMALNVFFQENDATVTNVRVLSEEDFHHKQTNRPIKITATFEELSEIRKLPVEAFEEMPIGYYQRLFWFPIHNSKRNLVALRYFKPGDKIIDLPLYFPAIVKPNFGDSSFGITQRSVVKNGEQLLSAISEIREQFGYDSFARPDQGLPGPRWPR